MEMDRKDIDNMAFITHNEVYNYTGMRLGLINAPGTFRGAMHVIPATENLQYALDHIDDIFIFSTKLDEHLRHAEKVLKLLSNVVMTVKLKKGSCFREIINYLGHIIPSDKLHVPTNTTEVIKALQNPTTVSEFWSFFELYNFYRRLVSNFAKLASPLSKKVMKGEPLQISFNEEEMKAVLILKEMLITPPVLTLPKPKGQYAIDTDACDTQFESVLLQRKMTKSKSYRLPVKVFL